MFSFSVSLPSFSVWVSLFSPFPSLQPFPLPSLLSFLPCQNHERFICFSLVYLIATFSFTVSLPSFSVCVSVSSPFPPLHPSSFPFLTFLSSPLVSIPNLQAFYIFLYYFLWFIRFFYGFVLKSCAREWCESGCDVLYSVFIILLSLLTGQEDLRGLLMVAVNFLTSFSVVVLWLFRDARGIKFMSGLLKHIHNRCRFLNIWEGFDMMNVFKHTPG